MRMKIVAQLVSVAMLALSGNAVASELLPSCQAFWLCNKGSVNTGARLDGVFAATLGLESMTGLAGRRIEVGDATYATRRFVNSSEATPESVAPVDKEFEKAIADLSVLYSQDLISLEDLKAAKLKLETARKARQASVLAASNPAKTAPQATDLKSKLGLSPLQIKEPGLVIQKQAATPSAPAVKEWEITEADATLKTLLERWAKKDGWDLKWKLENDFNISAKTSLKGSLESVFAMVLDSVRSSEKPMVATFYAVNKVVVIEAKRGG